MYQYVLFDLDGTLTDPGEGITNSVRYALGKWNIEVAERSELYKFIGPPLVESFKKYYGFSDEQSAEAVKYYREYFTSEGIFQNKVYDGIGDMLAMLKSRGKTVILATSKPEKFAVDILKHFNLFEYFDFISGATMDGKLCKKGDIIDRALAHFKITDKSLAVMVGDREQDVLGAKQVGIACVGVLFGYGDYEELTQSGADYIAANVRDIIGCVS